MEVMVAVQSGASVISNGFQRNKTFHLRPRSHAIMLPVLYTPFSSRVRWPHRPYAHEPGATAVTDWLGIAFSTDWLSTDDLGQHVGERAQK